MGQNHTNGQKERLVLSHEPIEAYKPVFYIAVAVAVSYLAYIFIWGGRAVVGH